MSIRYGQPHVGLWFDARWLALPVVQSPQSLREFLAGSPANLIVRYRDTSSLTERIRRLLRKGLGSELPSLEEVGDALAVTPQTLRRRLRDEGRGFQQIKDELRRDAAIEYLLHTPLPLLEIANRVGFSEPAPSIAPSSSGRAWRPASTGWRTGRSAEPWGCSHGQRSANGGWE